MKNNRSFKGVWIPKEIWLNTDLTLQEKCILVEIDSLDSSEKGCFASNEFIGEHMNLSAKRIANIITDLKNKGYIKQVFNDGRIRGLRITLNISFDGRSDLPNPGDQVPESGRSGSRIREHSNTVSKPVYKTIYNVFYDSQIEKHCKDASDNYILFVDWLFKKNITEKPLTKILNLNNQISYKRFNELRSKYTSEQIEEVILALQNYTKRSYSSLNLTISKWLKKFDEPNKKLKLSQSKVSDNNSYNWSR